MKFLFFLILGEYEVRDLTDVIIRNHMHFIKMSEDLQMELRRKVYISPLHFVNLIEKFNQFIV